MNECRSRSEYGQFDWCEEHHNTADGCTIKKLRAELEQTKLQVSELRKLMGHWSTVELALKAQEETNRLNQELQKRSPHPADIVEELMRLATMAKESIDDDLEERASRHALGPLHRRLEVILGVMEKREPLKRFHVVDEVGTITPEQMEAMGKTFCDKPYVSKSGAQVYCWRRKGHDGDHQ